ncbi:hypothetical protein [Candidatus Deferrimicrobium sp.]|uniref:hypothetical protein n=1 Tax=Candidatus Deferrimicrobium sp. TaxID=3060586 RepID=UPI002ED3B3E1
MRKPVYLAVLGISVVVAAVSLGVTLTRYLGMRAYSPKGTAQAAASPAGRALPDIPPEQWNNLFAPGDGMNLASRLPAVNAKSGSQASRTAFVLVGTIVSSTSSARRAILWASSMKEPKAFREKDEVEPGAFLASVERDKVWITRGKEREKLEILPVGSRARPAATGSPTVAPTVASAVPQPAPSPAMLPRPGPAALPGTLPDRTQALVVAPKASPGGEDEEDISPRERRRRNRGLR